MKILTVSSNAVLPKDVRGMKNSREFPFPFPVFPGTAGMGMKYLKTCIISEIPHSPGMGMNFMGNPGNKFFCQISIFRIIKILSKVFIKEEKLFGFCYSFSFHNIKKYYRFLPQASWWMNQLRDVPVVKCLLGDLNLSDFLGTILIRKYCNHY